MSIKPRRLETPRLILRPWTLEDAPRVQELASVREVADTTLNIPHPYPPGAAREWIGSLVASFNDGTGVVLAIVLRETMQACGSIGIHLNTRHRHAEMGYWLGLPYWNHGYVTEAAAAMLDYGFTELDLHRIYATHFPRNPASGRVMQKIGMAYEGCMRGHVYKDGSFEDLALYGIMRSDWEGRNVAPAG